MNAWLRVSTILGENPGTLETHTFNQSSYNVERKSKAPEKRIGGGWGRGLCAGNHTDLTDNIQSDSNGFQSQPMSSARTVYISLR